MSTTEELFRSYLDLRWHFDPPAASAAGVTASDDRLGDFTPGAMRAHLAAFRSIAGAVEQLEVDDAREEIERTAFLDEVRITIARFERERPHVHDPGFWLSHLLAGYHTLLRRRYGTPAERARGLFGRIRATPGFLKGARETLHDPPRIFLETAQKMAAAAPRLLADAAAAVRAGAPELAEPLEAAFAEADAALARFTVALRGDLAAHHDDLSFAIGEDQFNRRLHHEHALRAGAPELYRYGLRLVEAVAAEVEGLARQIDPAVPWRTVVERLRSRYAVRSDLRAAFRDAVDRARSFLEARQLVSIPEGDLEVIETPDFLRPLLPFAAYDPPGPYAPERTGTLYVTTPRPGEAPAHDPHGMLEIAATAVHETWPGHHLQMLTAQAQPSEIRRVLWTPITVEGWALYCEELMAEQGFFASLEERLFQRLHLLWRALRIVLDVGLHTRGMTPDQAMDLLVDRVGMDRSQAEAEVSRYCAWPTYQLCYAVGRREILQLRDAWRARAGPGGELREFHDAFLAWGGLPVSLIRWGMGLGIDE
ncbi:MAG TPA: DUF885 domain-containing protein [Gemmatimonadales bacterium]|nr:DUF885 domain-containing protein [Gemmatimonadales bacterium]